MNREAINLALAERLFAIDGIRTVSRIVRDRDQVAPSECPALFLAPGGVQRLSDIGSPARRRLEFVAYLHVHDPSTVGPSVQLNAYVDAIEDALERDETDPDGLGMSEHTTLGGLVLAASVSDVVTDEGSYGDRALALVTIEVLKAG